MAYRRGEEMKVIKNKNTFRIISAAIMILGLVMFLINGFNFGIDFTGGTIIEINANKFIDVDQAKLIMDEYDNDASIIHGGANKEEVIIKSTLDLSNETVNSIISAFAEQHGVNKDNIKSEKFGPTMGKEISDKALLSISIATIAMLLYITFRFEWRFGLGAIIALLHDVIITVAVYAIFKLPINSSFIAAILTIVGYSINDTIVIFDRIREELRLNPRVTLENIVDTSIHHSLRRTIITTVTTLVSVVVLYIVGVEAVKVLALPLIIGMISGTYSSLFIAPALWFDFKNKKFIGTAR